MHSTRPSNNAGHTSGCTTRFAMTSITTETNILTVAHNITLTALAPGDVLLIGLVMPRAIKAPGTTTVAAPYSTDHATSCLPVAHADNSAATTPTANCTPSTHHGESGGS